MERFSSEALQQTAVVAAYVSEQCGALANKDAPGSESQPNNHGMMEHVHSTSKLHGEKGGGKLESGMHASLSSSPLYISPHPPVQSLLLLLSSSRSVLLVLSDLAHTRYLPCSTSKCNTAVHLLHHLLHAHTALRTCAHCDNTHPWRGR